MSESQAAAFTLNDNYSGSSLSDLAYERLLALMLSGELPGGSPLQERKLALRLGISRTPMREALARLESKGLVERQFNRFLIVRQLSLREFIEVLNVRKLLEMEAARLAASRVPEEEIEAARKLVTELQAAQKVTVAMGWAADEAVHNLMTHHSGNKILAETVRELRHRTHMFETRRVPNRLHDSCTEHLALLQALEDHDEHGARQLIEQHLENVKKITIAKLSND
jgi:DNA-binding GntR family transcriptional regulator